jgi:type IV pilus assembly protein PilB
MAQKLGNFLVREGLITPEQLDSALQEQKANGGMLGSNLVKMQYIEEAELMEFLSKQFGVPSTDPSKLDVDSDVIEMIPGNYLLGGADVDHSHGGSLQYFHH